MSFLAITFSSIPPSTVTRNNCYFDMLRSEGYEQRTEKSNSVCHKLLEQSKNF